MRKFVTIPGKRVKLARNRFGGDNRRFDRDDDLPEERRTGRQDRRQAKMMLRSALTSNDFGDPEEGS
jgi:hypothetical protein